MTKSTKDVSKKVREKMEMPGWKVLTSLQLLMQLFVFLFSGTTLVGTVCFLTVFPTFARQPIHVATYASYRHVETLPMVRVAPDKFLDPIVVNVEELRFPAPALPALPPESVPPDETAPDPRPPLPAPPDRGSAPNPPTNLTVNY